MTVDEYCNSPEKPKVSKNQVPALEVGSANMHLWVVIVAYTHISKTVSESKG